MLGLSGSRQPGSAPRTTADAFADLDSILHAGIADRVFPGAAVACGKAEKAEFQYFTKGYGTHTYESSIPVTPESIFDVASLTKVVATVPAVMRLYEAGLIDIESPVSQYLPEFAQNGKETVTVAEVLTHTGGLRVFYPFHRMGMTTPDQVIEFICADRLWHPRGETKYSDLSMIVIGVVVERITCCSLDRFVHHAVFRPLGMHSTGFRPVKDGTGADDAVRVVPTEVDREHRQRLLWGEVHDPNCYVLGGVAGHAGLFSSAQDLSRFARTMLAEGVTPEGARLLRADTVRLFTSRGGGGEADRALGWDMRSKEKGAYSSSGTCMGDRAYGHTGFTGTSMWLDPEQGAFVLLLTNAVHPWAEAESVDGLKQVRADVADAGMRLVALASLRHWNFRDSMRGPPQPPFPTSPAGDGRTPQPVVPLPLLLESPGMLARGTLLSASVVSGKASVLPWEPCHAACLERYTVQEDDRAVRIACRRSMSLSEMQQLNPGVDLDCIHPGQELWVVAAPTRPPTHPGQAGASASSGSAGATGGEGSGATPSGSGEGLSAELDGSGDGSDAAPSGSGEGRGAESSGSGQGGGVTRGEAPRGGDVCASSIGEQYGWLTHTGFGSRGDGATVGEEYSGTVDDAGCNGEASLCLSPEVGRGDNGIGVAMAPQVDAPSAALGSIWDVIRHVQEECHRLAGEEVGNDQNTLYAVQESGVVGRQNAAWRHKLRVVPITLVAMGMRWVLAQS